MKVNWYHIEREYITKPRLTYDAIAKHTGVAKSTVVRHAKKESWQQKRAIFQEEVSEKILAKRRESAAEVDERHIKKSYLIQDTMSLQLSILIEKMTTTPGGLSGKEQRELIALSNAYYKAVMEERKLKGLNTKPVQIHLHNSEDIDRYLEAIGAKEPPIDENYRKTKEAIESLDRMIEHRQLLQSMIDETNKKGSFN